MSNTTLQVIHPLSCVAGKGEQLFRMLDNTTGRDKLTKTIQYALKIAIWHTENTPSNANVKTFHNNISLARRCFRIGKFGIGYIALFRYIESILKNTQNDPVFNGISTLQKLIMSTYMGYDTLNWFTALKLLPDEPQYWSAWAFQGDAPKYKARGNKLWCLASFLGLILAIWVLVRKYQEYQKLDFESRKNTDEKVRKVAKAEKLKLHKAMPKDLRNIVKNVMDLLVSSSYSGYWDTNQGVIGSMGIISALVAAYDIWYKYEK